MTQKVRYTFKVDAHMLSALDDLAWAVDISVTKLIENFIKQGMQRLINDLPLGKEGKLVCKNSELKDVYDENSNCWFEQPHCKINGKPCKGTEGVCVKFELIDPPEEPEDKTPPETPKNDDSSLESPSGEEHITEEDVSE